MLYLTTKKNERKINVRVGSGPRSLCPQDPLGWFPGPTFSFPGKCTPFLFKTDQQTDFPGEPVVKDLHFRCRGCGFYPWLGN